MSALFKKKHLLGVLASFLILISQVSMVWAALSVSTICASNSSGTCTPTFSASDDVYAKITWTGGSAANIRVYVVIHDPTSVTTLTDVSGGYETTSGSPWTSTSGTGTILVWSHSLTQYGGNYYVATDVNHDGVFDGTKDVSSSFTVPMTTATTTITATTLSTVTTFTSTATELATVTNTATESATITNTATELATVTNTATESATITNTATELATVTNTATELSTVTNTLTETTTVTQTETSTVTGTAPRDVKNSVLQALVSLRSTATLKHDQDRLDKAISSLYDSLSPSLWVDSTHLDPKQGDQVFKDESDAVKQMADMIKDPKSLVNKSTLQSLIDQLVGADRQLASTAINDAIGANGKAKQIAEAQKELGTGDTNAANNPPQHSADAIDHYAKAWKQAQQAVGH